jgi:hypothetical protein
MLIYFLLIILAGFPVVTSDGEQNVPGNLKIFGEILRYDDFVNSKAGSETVEDLTLYVATTGNDGNNCLTAGTACLTIQEAVNRVPTKVVHDVIINIGAGNFAGFTVAGFTVPRYVGTLLIQGTLDNPTLTTGTTSGTADAGSTVQCVDNAGPGQNWTVNELRGMLVLVGSDYRVIRNNTADTMNLIGPLSATCNGKSYEIFEQKTVINSASPDYASANIWVTSNQAGRDNSIEFSDLKTTGNTYAIFHHYGDGMKWVRIHSTGAVVNILIQSIGGETIIEDCYVEGGTYGYGIVEISGQLRAKRLYSYTGTYGFYLYGNGALTQTSYLYNDAATNAGFAIGHWSEVFISDIFAEGATGTGVGMKLSTSQQCQIEDLTVKSNAGSGIINLNTPLTLLGTIDISSNGGYGITLGGNVAPTNVFLSGPELEIAGTATIATNTSGGILAEYFSFVRLGDVDGANTGAYGLTLTTGSYAIITSATGITGTTDDATINGGTTPLDWSTDFSSNGDIVVNIDTGTRIERSD